MLYICSMTKFTHLFFSKENKKKEKLLHIILHEIKLLLVQNVMESIENFNSKIKFFEPKT